MLEIAIQRPLAGVYPNPPSWNPGSAPGNTSWKCWKWHLQDSRFQNFLGGGGAYYFLSAIHFKTYWEQIRKVNFWQCRTLNSFCFRGLLPLDPQRGSAPVPCWGHQPPPDPSFVWEPLAPIAVYFQNITVYFKSYWQPWMGAWRVLGMGDSWLGCGLGRPVGYSSALGLWLRLQPPGFLSTFPPLATWNNFGQQSLTKLILCQKSWGMCHHI